MSATPSAARDFLGKYLDCGCRQALVSGVRGWKHSTHRAGLGSQVNNHQPRLPVQYLSSAFLNLKLLVLPIKTHLLFSWLKVPALIVRMHVFKRGCPRVCIGAIFYCDKINRPFNWATSIQPEWAMSAIKAFCTGR